VLNFSVSGLFLDQPNNSIFGWEEQVGLELLLNSHPIFSQHRPIEMTRLMVGTASQNQPSRILFSPAEQVVEIY